MLGETVKLLVPLGLLVACIKCSVSRNSTEPRSAQIVAGTNAGAYDHPYMVLIRRDNQPLCGGTLLTPHCVLTAAHCVARVADEQLNVHAGSVRLDAAENLDVRVSKVARSLIPYNFVQGPSYVHMDVAILRLKSPLEGVNIEPVEIDLAAPVDDGDSLTVLGWGAASYDARHGQQHLQVANVTGISQESCSYFYYKTNMNIYVSQSVFCHLVTDGKTACMGDSGGPAMRNGKQVGIVSWGVDCGLHGDPAAFTSLAYHSVARFLDYYKRNAC